MIRAQVKLIIGLGRAVAFILGAMFSLMVGQFGMRMAVQANVRVAAASRTSYDKAMQIAYRAGTITGMLTDGLGLFGGTIIFLIFQKAAPDALLGFGFGGTLLALFMRVGGGIYTKAADVGADLVGKVEASIPEDDPRNAAVIADLVGDNVGDCAGMAADIFESYEVTIVSGLILSLALVAMTGQIKWLVFPLLVRGIGVFSSIIGTYLVKGKKGAPGDAMKAINKGFYTSAAICLVAFAVLAGFYMHEWRAFLSVAVGIVLAVAIDELTKYFTHTKYNPVKSIARSSRTGAATLILSGLSVGMESAVWTLARHRRDHPLLGLHLLGPADRLRPLRRGHDRHRDADPDRQQRGHGLLRPDRRQRQRHRRDGRPCRGGPGADGRPRRRREHDQGHHQGRGHRLGGHRRRLALRVLPHGRDQGPGPDGRRPRPASSSRRGSASPSRSS